MVSPHALLLLTTVLPATASSSMPTVNSTGSSLVRVSTVASLVAAVNESTATTVELALSGSPFLLEQPLVISRSMTLRSEALGRATLDAQHRFQVVHVRRSAHVTLHGLHMTHGRANTENAVGGRGGCVLVSGLGGARLTISASIVDRCSAYEGGGIAVEGDQQLLPADIDPARVGAAVVAAHRASMPRLLLTEGSIVRWSNGASSATHAQQP
jgi:hypothetical protein